MQPFSENINAHIQTTTATEALSLQFLAVGSQSPQEACRNSMAHNVKSVLDKEDYDLIEV